MIATVLAVYTRIAVCPNGCPIIVFSDADEEPFAEAHIKPECIEELIADLRRALAEGAAARRPLA